MLLPLLQGLSERQARLFLMLAAVTSRHQADALQKLVDEDIAQAAGALASTLETAAKGIVYEHQPASLVAARLMAELKGVVDEVVKNAGSALERDAAIALRRIEHAAKMMATVRPNSNELQQLLARRSSAAARGGTRARSANGSRFVLNHPLRYNFGFLREEVMSKVCKVCGKKPVVGRTVSHAHNVRPRRFEPNLQVVRALINGGVKRIRVCTRCLRSNKVTKAA